MPRTAKKTAVEVPINEQFDFTKSFQKLKPESFFAFLQQYPSWEAAAVYVYRLWPVIDRKLTGNKAKYIAVYPSPITADDLLNEHGSGKYRLHLNDSNRAKAAVQVASCDVHLDDPERRPILNQRELVIGDDRNKSYIDGLKARGQWNEDQDTNVSSAGAAANQDLSRVLEKAIDRIAEKSSEPPAPQSPLQSLREVLELQQMLQPKMQQSDPWEIALKIASLVQRRDEPKQDPLEVYTRVADLVERRNPQQAAGDSWPAVLMAFLQSLPSLAQMLLAARATPGASPAASMSNLPSVQVREQENSMAQRPPTPQQLFAELRPFLMKALISGQAGDEFAAGLITFVGRDKYDQICALGPDGILGQVKAMADLWPLLEPYSMEVRKFIGDFIEYGLPVSGPEGPTAESTQ